MWSFLLFFFNDTATTEIYTLSLHDALPIWITSVPGITHEASAVEGLEIATPAQIGRAPRLNSSHGYISYAVFCLKKKKPRRRHRSGRRSDSRGVLPSDVPSCRRCHAYLPWL